MHFNPVPSVLFALFGLALGQDATSSSPIPPGQTFTGEIEVTPAATPSTFITSRIPTSIPTGATFTRSMPTIPTASGPAVRYWFSFGDSYTSSNFSIDGTQPSIDNPLGNPQNPAVEDSHGATWIPYITTKYNKTLTLTYNLARGGAVISVAENVTINPQQNYARRSFKGQVAVFTSRYASLPTDQTPWKQDVTTMYSSWFGINDIDWIFKTAGNASDPRIEESITAQLALLDQLYFDVDAKSFLIINLPPLEASPRYASVPKASQKMKTMVTAWNRQLSQKVEEFKESHPVANVVLVDGYSIIKKVLDNPEGYGFKKSEKRSDVWSDSFHLNTKVHRILAREVAGVLGNGSLGGGNSTLGSATGVPTSVPTMGHGSSATSGPLW
ncbi:hypothetical protein TWF281_007482 [Arthrobotrys megalospora]